MFNHIEKILSGLLYQHAAEKNSKGTNIAPQRKFFGGIRCGSRQLRKPRFLIFSRPQWSLAHDSS